MKKVIFKFIGLGFNNFHQAYIKVYDNNKNILYDTKTYNGKAMLCLKENESYLLIARVKNKVLKKVIFINKKTNRFIFSFYNRIITFLLRDEYYNLPIKKGELILWQT